MSVVYIFFMNFNRNPEEQFAHLEEKEIGEKKLEGLIKEIAEKSKAEGIFLTTDCRVDIEAFRGFYPEEELIKDKKLIDGNKKKWQENEGDKEKKLKQDGEKLEILKTVLFYKFLNQDFIVARTSEYDDIENKADNIILNKETGNIVCAFDEVSDMSGVEFENKKIKVLNRNIEGKGSRLKYGFEKNKDRLDFKRISNLPLFYLALDKEHLEEGVKNLTPSLKEKSEYDGKLWNYFVASLKAQISFLKLKPNKLNFELKNRLEQFEKDIERF